MATYKVPDLPVYRGVHITSDNGQVDVKDVEISKSMADQVTWFAHGAAGAIIEFSSPDGSPFEESTFQVPATGSISSGPAKRAAVVNKYYKYTVKGRTGKNDPGVIIHN
ncbi:MAG TPA: hypothetical protein VIX19_02295 [Terriglobales bacterium]